MINCREVQHPGVTSEIKNGTIVSTLVDHYIDSWARSVCSCMQGTPMSTIISGRVGFSISKLDGINPPVLIENKSLELTGKIANNRFIPDSTYQVSFTPPNDGGDYVVNVVIVGNSDCGGFRSFEKIYLPTYIQNYDPPVTLPPQPTTKPPVGSTTPPPITSSTTNPPTTPQFGDSPRTTYRFLSGSWSTFSPSFGTTVVVLPVTFENGISIEFPTFALSAFTDKGDTLEMRVEKTYEFGPITEIDTDLYVLYKGKAPKEIETNTIPEASGVSTFETIYGWGQNYSRSHTIKSWGEFRVDIDGWITVSNIVYFPKIKYTPDSTTRPPNPPVTRPPTPTTRPPTPTTPPPTTESPCLNINVLESPDTFDNRLYFKYSNGGAFLLDGEDYKGFINNSDGIILTNKTKSDESFELTPKDTFISEIYEDKKEFDLSLGKKLPLISNISPNKLKNLNKIDLDTIFNNLNENNLNIYKNLVSLNKTVYSGGDTSVKFFAISANESSPYGFKSDYIHTSPLKIDDDVRYLNRTTGASLIVDSQENFKYFLTTSNELYTLSGNFGSNSPMSVIQYINLYPTNDVIPDKIHSILRDNESNRLFFVRNDSIEIYATDNFDECQKLVVLDRINLNKTITIKNTWSTFHRTYTLSDLKYKQRAYTTFNDNNPKSIKISKNYRTKITKNTLEIYNKYSKNIVKSYNILEYGVCNYLDLDIRYLDDCIIILHENNGIPYVLFINPTTNYINNKKLSYFDLNSDNFQIKFSELDSNVFIVSNDHQYHTRYLSFPSIPIGKLENAELYYVDRHKWGSPFRFKPLTYENFKFQWTSSIQPSNILKFINITETTNNDKSYMISQNMDRLYLLQQPLINQYNTLIPFELYKLYNGIEFSESSIGLYLNSYIISIITDTLNIYKNSKGFFTVKEGEIIDNIFGEIELEFNDLIINTNEELNVFTIKRILSKLEDIQRFLSPILEN